MRLREGIAALGAAMAFALLAPAGAAAAEPITDQLACHPRGDVEICSGEVPSFDGSPLDVDVTKPVQGGGKHPIMAMMHGFGNDKREWEFNGNEGDGADKFHWNNHWFAEHGYYVINYTARGFHTDPPSGDKPDTPTGTSEEKAPPQRGVLRLKSREYEVRDTQWLAALVARDFDGADGGRVAVTGGSYGGGESWLQASRSQFTFPHSQDDTLPVLDLQVAVPKYPWTDLAYSLGPNGHPGGPAGNDLYESSYGHPDDDNGEGYPFGILKSSFVGGLFALGATNGTFQSGASTFMPPPEGEGPIDVAVWNERTLDGEPYEDTDPIVLQIRRGLTEFRSAYYQQDGWASQQDGRKVAVFAIQGWTDDLFPALEGFRMFKYLKRLDPRWPVELEVADIGHSRGANKPATWRRLNAQAFQFLQSNINGSRDQETRVSSEPTVCEERGNPDQQEAPAQRLSAKSPEALGPGSLTVNYTSPGSTNSAAAATDPNGPATDPAFGDTPLFGQDGGCRTSPGPATGGFTAYSQPLKQTQTYVGLGFARVAYTMTGTESGTLNARLWDDPPGDDTKPLLVSRGAYRIDTLAGDSAADTIRLPLFGNHWRFKPGHRIRLDLTPVDAPYLRPANGAYQISFTPPSLRLPTRESGDRAIAGD
jgi:predicted acyl esterase